MNKVLARLKEQYIGKLYEAGNKVDGHVCQYSIGHKIAKMEYNRKKLTAKADFFRLINEEPVLKVIIDFKLNPLALTFTSVEELIITRQIQVMVEYWCKYARMHGVEDVVILSPRGGVYDDLKKVIRNQSFGNGDDFLKEYLQRISNNEVLGGFLGGKTQNYFRKFAEKRDEFSKVFVGDSLVSLPARENLNKLMNEKLTIHFCGQSYWATFDAELEYVRIQHTDSLVDSNVPVHQVLISEAHLKVFFKVLKEKNRLKHLVRPPMDMFCELVKRLFFVSEELVVAEFDRLSNELGSWEQVEMDCKYMLQNFRKDMEIFSVSKQQNENTSYNGKSEFQEIKVKIQSTPEHNYLFLYINMAKKEIFRVFVTKEATHPEIKSIVSGMLLDGL